MILLLVLAPSPSASKEALSLLAKWVITLRQQHASFDNMRLGLLRLDSLFRLGLEKAFYLPSYVTEAMHNELPTPTYHQ